MARPALTPTGAGVPELRNTSRPPGRHRAPPHAQPGAPADAGADPDADTGPDADRPTGRDQQDPAATAATAPARHPRRRIIALVAIVALISTEAVLIAPMLGDALHKLSHVNLAWVLVAVLAAAVSMGMFALTRRALLLGAGLRVPVRGTVAPVYVANAMHSTLPGGAAFSTAYTYRWMRTQGAGAAVATWCLAAGGLVSSGALVLVGLTGSLLAGGRGSPVQLVLEVGGVVALAVGARALGRRPELVVTHGRRVLRLVNRLRRRPPEHGAAGLDGLVAQLRLVRPRGRDWAGATGFALLNWLFDVGCLAACAAATGLSGLTLPLLLVAYTTGVASSSVSLLPGGIGIVDAALVLTFVAGGIPASAALPAVVLYRLISFLGVVAAGWVICAVRQIHPSSVTAADPAELAGRA